MDFIDQVKQFSKRVEAIKDNIQTEEATKTSIIMPFFSLLGYDVFNPNEFVPEFTADVGIKKGEKVDYAIFINNDPVILIEAKWVGAKLENHDSQLFRYFGTTKSKFAILTNGIHYRFFTDLDEPNKMDKAPFMEFNLFDIKETQISELKKFHKTVFDLNSVMDSASELKYSNEFKAILNNELNNPSDSFTKHFLTGVYSGQKNQNVIEKFRPILKKSLNAYINELMNEKIKAALNVDSDSETAKTNTVSEENIERIVEDKEENKIVTTNEELEAYFIIKHLLSDIVPMQEITYKDTEKYINILHLNNVRRWICRLILKENTKWLIIPDANKKDIKIQIDNIYDINNYKSELSESLNRYLQ